VKEEPTLLVLDYGRQMAAVNMAIDASLYQLHESGFDAILRLYGWSQPAMSFGYFQRWADVSTQIPEKGEMLDIVRRPSGGGIVDHRDDLTYALALSTNLPRAQIAPTCLYEKIHNALAEALAELGQASRLAQPDDARAPALACFTRPVRSDVLDPSSRKKIAGAALHRTRHGILAQGSLSRALISPSITSDQLTRAFARTLKESFGLALIKQRPLSDQKPEESEIEKFASDTWKHRR
jgi:lipoate-protein ligase A